MLFRSKNLGIKISYLEQSKPRGLPDAFVIGEKFIGKENVAMILGDNFFYGQNLTSKLLENTKLKKGARVVLHKVTKPELFGVAKVNKYNKIVAIKEKPKKFLSDLAITGLYFFDKNVCEFSRKLKPSKRGELEITDLIYGYKKRNRLKFEMIGRGAIWSDAGKIEDLSNVSSYVKSVEKVQGIKIACLEEISLLKKWIDKKKIAENIKFYGNCDYSTYLKKIII